MNMMPGVTFSLNLLESPYCHDIKIECYYSSSSCAHQLSFKKIILSLDEVFEHYDEIIARNININ